MATKIRHSTSEKQRVRFKRKKRIRSNMEGTAERPRMSVFRSNKAIYIQLIDDVQGRTLIAADTRKQDIAGNSIEAAKKLGGTVAGLAKAANITKVVFDRSGYLYHGRVKAVADSAREHGLQF